MLTVSFLQNRIKTETYSRSHEKYYFLAGQYFTDGEKLVLIFMIYSADYE